MKRLLYIALSKKHIALTKSKHNKMIYILSRNKIFSLHSIFKLSLFFSEFNADVISKLKMQLDYNLIKTLLILDFILNIFINVILHKLSFVFRDVKKAHFL